MKTGKAKLPQKPVTSNLLTKTEEEIYKPFFDHFWETLDPLKEKWYSLI